MDFLTLAGQIFTLIGEYLSQNTFLQAVSSEWKILSETHALAFLATSAFCGGMVGLEREYAHKPAGLRTNIMICVGSCLYTLASIYSWKYLSQSNPAVDPSRIAAQIVTGVGFIGAGVILKTGMHIVGITTASTIWLVAAIGMLIGMGFPLLGSIVAISATISLFLLGKFEKQILRQPPSPE